MSCWDETWAGRNLPQLLYRTWNTVSACLQPGCTSFYEQITLKQLTFVWIHTTQLV